MTPDPSDLDPSSLGPRPPAPAASVVLGLVPAAGGASVAAAEAPVEGPTAALDRRLPAGDAAACAISRCTLSFSARSASTCAMRSSASVLACGGQPCICYCTPNLVRIQAKRSVGRAHEARSRWADHTRLAVDTSRMHMPYGGF